MRYEGHCAFFLGKMVAEHAVVALAMLLRVVRPLEAKQKTSDQVNAPQDLVRR